MELESKKKVLTELDINIAKQEEIRLTDYKVMNSNQFEYNKTVAETLPTDSIQLTSDKQTNDYINRMKKNLDSLILEVHTLENTLIIKEQKIEDLEMYKHNSIAEDFHIQSKDISLKSKSDVQSTQSQLKKYSSPFKLSTSISSK